MRRILAVNEIEGETLSELMTALNRAERDAKIAFSMLVAQRGLKEAQFVALQGNALTIEVPE